MDAISAISGVGGRNQLTPEEQAEVAKLAARDREVRAHEAQHAAAAGSMAGGIEYSYEKGPDGKMYAVGGKTRIIMSASSTPEEALVKARQLRSAANAVTDPSGQDKAVAAAAGKMEADALEKIREKKLATTGNSAHLKVQPSQHGFDRVA